jgi:serine-type D-Ala-D-Ala carboxypeptidase/endopeptidase (penicillin-binding protein 4)
MKDFSTLKAVWLGIAVLVVASGTLAQGPSQRPLMQEIRVVREEPTPVPTPGVRRTGSSAPLNAEAPIAASTIRTAIPVLAEVMVPGFTGILVETLDGEVVVENGSNFAYNPASNVKVATTYAVLKVFGPDYRFPTSVWTDGAINRNTATLYGNLYISGRDPVFGFEHAMYVANELNRLGIRRIEGDLVITDNFSINQSNAPVRAAQTLFATLDMSRRSAAATRAWGNFRIHSGKGNTLNDIPNVSFSGGVYVQSMPTNVRMLFSHESAPMRDIVKVMMSYSNNHLSERLGEMVGGPYGIASLVIQGTGVGSMEFSIQTASGLGINRVTPNAMMRLLRVLRNDLAGWRMTFADVMPVAGLDVGTLEGRFATPFARGSVVGKTGTLARTDSGVSTLAGEINTRGGKLLFVIFNQRGSVPRFRSFQNEYVSLILGQFGGALPVNYTPVPHDTRLARTQITYPDSRPRISE